MIRIVYIILIAVTGCLLGCRHEPDNTMPEAAEAEKLLNSRPDSLIDILEKKINPELLNDSSKAYYWLMLTQAHQRCGRGLVNDSMINFSVDYYKKERSPRLPMACFIAADQANYSGLNIDKQIEGYEKAIEAIETTGDSTYWLLAYKTLGSLYWRSRDHNKMKEMARKLLANALSDGDKSTAWFQLGLSYKYNTDSASYCFERAMQIVRDAKDNSELHITRNYADYLISINKNKEALQLLDELELRIPDCNSDNLLFTRLYAYINLGDLNRAKPYMERMEQIAAENAKSSNFVAAIYRIKLLRLIYDAKRGVPLDLTHYGQFNDSVENARRTAWVTEKEQLRSNNKLIQDKQELQIEQQRLHQIYMSIVIVILIIAVVMIFMYQRKLLLKERFIREAREEMRMQIIRLRENEYIISKNEDQIKQISEQLQQSSGLKERLSEQQSEIEEITRWNNNLQQENKDLQKGISKYADALIMKDRSTEVYEQLIERCELLAEREKQLSAKLTDLIDILKNIKTGAFSHLSDIDWPQVYSSLNQIFNNYTQRLQNDYPLLTEEDIQCCCLIKLRMTTSAIANIYSITPASATKRKQRIRERINQSKEKSIDKNLSIDVYLWEY